MYWHNVSIVNGNLQLTRLRQNCRPCFVKQGAGIEWGILNQEVKELYQTGKYDRAVLVAVEALKVAAGHTDVATSLNNWAELYRTQDDYAKAEPLYKRSLAILEKTLGPNHLCGHEPWESCYFVSSHKAGQGVRTIRTAGGEITCGLRQRFYPIYPQILWIMPAQKKDQCKNTGPFLLSLFNTILG